MMTSLARLAVLVLLFSFAPAAGAQTAQAVPEVAPPAPRSDERLKLDVLVVVAHPDDETAVATYLAKAVFDEGRRVGVAYVTDGEGGGNQIANERAASLSAVRQLETRRALDELGIRHYWFLSGRDTASQNVLFSLANWPHGAVLEEVVRVIRLTRPEVVMSWMPRVVAGENHGDHQASGVVATEAFFMAGDPTAFPAQLAPPRLRLAVENLRPWYPKKLYFFSDAFDESFLAGHGPSYDPDAVSPARKAPYAYITTRAASHHLSQFGPRFPRPLLDAIAREDVEGVMKIVRERRTGQVDPLRLALGWQHGDRPVTADVFDGIRPGEPVAPAILPLTTQARPSTPAPNLTLDGPWSFYRAFAARYAMPALVEQLPIDLGVRPAHELRIPLRLANPTAEAREITLERTSPLPPGWTETPLSKSFRLSPGDEYRMDAIFMSPPVASPTPVEFTYTARSGGQTLGTVSLKVLVRLGAMPH